MDLSSHSDAVLQRVSSTMLRHNMVSGGHRLGVAVSGGADSVCLLHALRRICPDRVTAILHVNHKLRGSESDEDEGFVRSLGRPVLVCEAPVDGTGNLEQSARDARFRWFRELIATGAVDRVALGHTLDDQAETVLFRFLRGSGTTGLSAIHPVNGPFIRPLLELRREEVRHYLKEKGIPWREDSSNSDLRFARNRIRRTILPELVSENPALLETLARTAEWALAEEDYWIAEVARLAPGILTLHPPWLIADCPKLNALPVAAARRLLRYALQRVSGDLRGVNFHHVEEIRSLARAGAGSGRLQLPGIEVRRSFQWMRFGPSERRGSANAGFDHPLPVPVQEFPLPGGRVVSTELRRGDCVYNDGGVSLECALLDWARIDGPLQVRNWRAGDRYMRGGRSHEEKIKSLFQQASIPQWERQDWPIITLGSQIVWASRFGAANSFLATADSRIILLIRESKPIVSTS